jgi:hypothetical protein
VSRCNVSNKTTSSCTVIRSATRCCFYAVLVSLHRLLDHCTRDSLSFVCTMPTRRKRERWQPTCRLLSVRLACHTHSPERRCSGHGGLPLDWCCTSVTSQRLVTLATSVPMIQTLVCRTHRRPPRLADARPPPPPTSDDPREGRMQAGNSVRPDAKQLVIRRERITMVSQVLRLLNQGRRGAPRPVWTPTPEVFFLQETKPCQAGFTCFRFPETGRPCPMLSP